MKSILIAYFIVGALNYLLFQIQMILIRRVFNLKQYTIDFIIVFLLWPIFPYFWRNMYQQKLDDALKRLKEKEQK